MAVKLIRIACLFLGLMAGAATVLTAPACSGEHLQPAEIRLLTDSDYYPALLDEVGNAQQSIDLAMYLWKVAKSTKNKPRQLAEALVKAHRRGVSVRVVLENSGYAEEVNRFNRETAMLLEKGGVRVCFDSREVTTHSKLVIIDNRLVFLGSHNLTQSALARNHEISIMIANQDMAAGLASYFDKLIQPCSPTP